MWIVAGLLLGVLSRFEETTEGLSLGISSDSAWCGLAFVCGGPVRGALALSAANGSYYAYIALLQPDLSLDAVAGPPERWLGLGIVAGAVFGALGGAWRGGRRLVAVLPLALVLVIEGGDALRGGAATDGIGLLAGIALAVVAAPSRGAALVLAAVLVMLGATGAGAAYLP